MNILNCIQQTKHIENVTQNILSINNKEDHEIKSLEYKVPNLDLQSNKISNNLMNNIDNASPKDAMNLYQSSNLNENTDSLFNQCN